MMWQWHYLSIAEHSSLLACHEGTQTSRKKLAARSDKTRGEKGGEEQVKVLKEDKIQSKNNETKQANFSFGGGTLQKHQ